MRLHTLISLENDPFMEKWARLYRFKEADSWMRQMLRHTRREATLIDFGCGPDAIYYKYLSVAFPTLIKRLHYIGLDPLLATSSTNPQFELIKSKFETANLKHKADMITMFAVLEHVDDPAQLLSRALTVLNPGGVLIATTPSWLAKPVLEFTSDVLGVISTREIHEHKQYFNHKLAMDVMKQATKGEPGFDIHHHYFELGLNNFLCIKKAASTDKQVRPETAKPQKKSRGR